MTQCCFFVLAFNEGEEKETGGEVRQDRAKEKKRENRSQKVRVRVRNDMYPWQTHFGTNIKCLIHQMF